jgi:hypothetical protein
MVQEETTGARKGTVRTTAAGINKPAKGEDEGDRYGEHRLQSDVRRARVEGKDIWGND